MDARNFQYMFYGFSAAWVLIVIYARGMRSPIIKDVSVIATAPAGSRLCVVKITTDQDGLYGYGCATFTQRADLVVPAVEKYLKPFLIGKPADRIDDTWQACYNSSYWRNGPVLNNAISGVDQALWDIKGRQAGMPVYQLLGGKCREAVDCYSHASGGEIPEAIESARKLMAQGFRHVRVQVGVPGMAGYGAGRGARQGPRRCTPARSSSRPYYIRRALKLLRGVPQATGRRDRAAARRPRARLAEPGGAVRQGRREVQAVLPGGPALAGGHRLLPPDPPAVRDAARHGRAVQQPARVDAADRRAPDRLHPHPRLAGRRPDALPQDRGLGEIFGVKTAWHGPGDVSPIGHMRQCHAGPGLLQLRHSGVFGVQRALRRKFSRAAR